MKTKKILTALAALLCVCLPSISQAQNARQVFDKTANALKSHAGIEAKFEAAVFKGKELAGETAGIIYVKGDKFCITSNAMITWFDGTTQWTMLGGSDEVNVTTPSQEEIQKINPYTFVNLYKKGYKLELTHTTYNGKTYYEARMKANSSKQRIAEMRIVIDPATYQPYSIRIREGKEDWTRIRVRDMQTGKTWQDEFFRFNSKDYPNAEVIDLR